MTKFICKAKKFFPNTKEELLYVFIALLGIVMISVSVFNNNYEPDTINSKLFSVMGDLGIGLFPTGIISFLLEKMQRREKEEERRKKRAAILYNLNIAIHAYLNTICNLIVTKKEDLKGHKVSDIIQYIQENYIEFEYSADEIETLKQLIKTMKEIFESPNPIFIVADIFSEDEERHFHLLIKEGDTLLNFVIAESCGSLQRRNFLSYLMVAFKEIGEYNKFLKMEYDGNNISITI